MLVRMRETERWSNMRCNGQSLWGTEMQPSAQPILPLFMLWNDIIFLTLWLGTFTGATTPLF